MRDDELLRQYLLGELSGEDEALFEARLIQDDGLFERAEAMEADLLEEHAHGGLSAAQRTRIRRHLSSSPATRSQLAVVRGLGTVAREEEPARVLAGPWGRMDLSRPWIRGLAAAAMLAIFVPSAWLAMKTAHLPEAQMEAQMAAQIPEKPPAPPIPTPMAPPVPDETVQAEPTPAPAPITPPEPAPEPVTWVLQLAFSTTRSGEGGVLHGQAPPPGTERAEIRLGLAAGDTDYGSYEVTLSRLGEPVLHEQGVEIRGQELVLRIDPEKLQEGTYTVKIDGVGSDGDAVTLVEQEVDIEPGEMNPPR